MKSKNQNRAICDLCGARFAPHETLAMFFHVLINHPFEFAAAPGTQVFFRKLNQAGESAGRRVASYLKGAK
jgi:hypothetical protein